jgi:hypothetical protein
MLVPGVPATIAIHDPRLRGKLDRAREADLIARWREQRTGAAGNATTREGAP